MTVIASSAEKLCDSLLCNCGLHFRKSGNRRKSPTAGLSTNTTLCEEKGKIEKKSFCCARTKGLGNTKYEQSVQIKKTPLADSLAYPVKNRQHHVKLFFLFFLGHVSWRMTELCEEATQMHQAQCIILGATLLLPWPAHDPLHHIHLDWLLEAPLYPVQKEKQTYWVQQIEALFRQSL